MATDVAYRSPLREQASVGHDRLLRFEPGLEGLRGLALLAVLVFHQGFAWARGGFLGVSTFFTLSGFLITSLLVGERHRSGRISLPAFWSRRFRRLMPAALLCLAGIVVFGATAADVTQQARLRADVLSALGYVSNWRFILSGQSYADAFHSPSPVLHFWSLAIEEQFYLLFPLTVAALFALFRGSRRALAIGLSMALVGSLAAMAIVYTPTNNSRAYYGGDTRAAELLVGALLALLLAAPTVRKRLERGSAAHVLAGLGAVAVLVELWFWHAAGQSDGWLYRGGLFGYAIVSAAVIAGSTCAGPLRAALSWRPLRWTGRVSYGAYLYHWPLFLALTPALVGLQSWPLFAVRVLATFALAAVSYQLVELPVRSGRAFKGHRALIALPLTAGVVAAGAFWVVAANPPPKFNPASLAEVSTLLRAPSPLIGPPPTSGARVKRPHMVMVVGDSIALTLGAGLNRWLGLHGGFGLYLDTSVSCPTWLGPQLRDLGVLRPTSAHCLNRDQRLTDSLRRYRPEVVVVLSCLTDVSDRRLPGERNWRTPGDAGYDANLRRSIAHLAGILETTGAAVAWLTCPMLAPHVDTSTSVTGTFPEASPARVARLDAILGEVRASEPRLRLFDLAGWLRQLPGGEMDPRRRPDGVHFSSSGGLEAADWLVPQLYRLST